MLVFFVIFILVAFAVQWYSLKNAGDHRKIRYECRPSVRSCEPGEEFTVYSTVTNEARRPSPVLRIEEHFPRELDVREAAEFNVKVTRDEHRIYRSTAVLRGRQQVKRSLKAAISGRGEYCFSFAEFHAGDFLGFREFDYEMPNDHRIVIYPPRIENDAFLKAYTNTMDEVALRKLLLEDPLSVCGYRDYTGREPMRQISWKQSAARRSLIVKQFDPVWQQSVMIVLDMQYHGDYDNHFKRQEICFSLARTVCDRLEDRHIGYRLFTNAIISNGISSFSSPGGRGGDYAKILYALGSAKNGEVCSAEELVTAACTGADRQRMIVFISTRRNDETARAVGRAKSLSGAEVLTVFAEDIVLPEPEDEPEEEGGEA
ncbi:MAG: DUF58 domain-containing protein [Clostridia bacterium]|nr:DUF58 domain-containing protein [Clostridia bacterium]